MRPDDDYDWGAEDGSPAALAARGAPHRPVLRVWGGCAHSTHGHLHPHRTLARLPLLRHHERRASLAARRDQLARPTRDQGSGDNNNSNLFNFKYDMPHTRYTILVTLDIVCNHRVIQVNRMSQVLTYKTSLRL